MALERADIGVLRGGARAHRALAQIDFLEGRPRARRVVVEQRALRDRLADGAFDVALAELVAALDLLVEAFQHAAGLLAGAARAFDGDVIAALLGHHAEAALDQREVLSVLAEQHGGEPVVLEGEHDLRGGSFLGSGGGRDRGIRCAQVGTQAPAAARPARWRCSASAPNKVLVPISVIATGTTEPIMRARRHHLHRLQIWGAADQLPRELARLLQQHLDGAADELRVEGAPLAGDDGLQPLQALGLFAPAEPGRPCRRPACPGAANT